MLIPTIETARLRLRPLLAEDAPAFARHIIDDRAVWRNLVGDSPPEALRVAYRAISVIQRAWQSGQPSVWAVSLDDAFIGYAGLHHIDDADAFEVTVALGSAYWSNGYGTEAAIASIRYGFEACGLSRIVAPIALHNEAGYRVAEKAGMAFLGVNRDYFYGEKRAVYIIDRENWKPVALPYLVHPGENPMPLPTLLTERLRLRAFTDADAEDYGRVIYADADVMEFLPGDVPPDPTAQARKAIARWHEYWDTYGLTNWAVEVRETNAFAGAAGLLPIPGDESQIEIAYAFGKDYWGKGYATEAAHAIMQHGFETLKLPRIVAVAIPAHTGSRRVMEKLGMTFEGVVTHFYEGEELAYYTLKREDWL